MGGACPVARDKVRGQAVMARLHERAPGVVHSIHYADLSRLVNEAGRGPRLPRQKRASTSSSITRRLVQLPSGDRGRAWNVPFATNHMAYVVLTHGLRERLIASAAPARVVNTASAAHNRPSSTSTTCNRLTAIEIQGVRTLPSSATFSTRASSRRRWGGRHGGHRHSLHPGFVATRFADQSGGLFSYIVRMAKTFAISPEKGADHRSSTRLFARGGSCQRRLLLQMSPGNALEGRTGRRRRQSPLAGVNPIGGNESQSS